MIYSSSSDIIIDTTHSNCDPNSKKYIAVLSIFQKETHAFENFKDCSLSHFANNKLFTFFLSQLVENIIRECTFPYPVNGLIYVKMNLLLSVIL